MNAKLCMGCGCIWSQAPSEHRPHCDGVRAMSRERGRVTVSPAFELDVTVTLAVNDGAVLAAALRERPPHHPRCGIDARGCVSDCPAAAFDAAEESEADDGAGR